MRLVRQSVAKGKDSIGHAEPPLLAEATVSDRVATPVAIDLISVRNWRHTPVLPSGRSTPTTIPRSPTAQP
jgi:hypothetical protein